jgi:hypothetical protein
MTAYTFCKNREEAMSDAGTALVTSYRNNIDRYHRLLQTRLTDVEREYIHARLSDCRCAIQVVLGHEIERGQEQDSSYGDNG